MTLQQRIPRRFIRTVPVDVPAECEDWWRRFGELHPGWERLTIPDPIDPADWPLLGHLHRHASSGAQLAGMVRLEAVYRWGGWYVDMDVEPVRSWQPLEEHTGVVVIGTEDGIHLTDAVFGAPPRHPAVRAVIDHVAGLYEAAAAEGRGFPGAQATGPLATTVVLGRRARTPEGLGDPGDVVVVPTVAFYPYSYLERHRADEDFGAVPGCYAVHRWHFSWAGT